MSWYEYNGEVYFTIWVYMVNHSEQNEYIQSATKSLQQLTPKLQSLMGKHGYQIFVEFAENIADKTSYPEIFASIKSRLDHIIEHPCFDKPAYETFKDDIQSVYYQHYDSIHNSSISEIENYIKTAWIVNKKIIVLQNDIKDYMHMSKNSEYGTDDYILLQYISHLLELYENYLYALQVSLLSDSQEHNLSQKYNTLIRYIEWLKNSNTWFQELLKTEKWELLMNFLLSSSFFRTQNLKQEDYPYCILYYHYIYQIFEELIKLVKDINSDLYDGELSIHETIYSYQNIFSSFKWEILQLRDDIVFAQIITKTLQSDIKQLLSLILSLWKQYYQKERIRLNNLEEFINSYGIEINRE